MELNDLTPGERFIERMGLAVEEEGLPRIAGRLFGLLLLDAGPYSFEELAERLQVSRGSISTNTRLLEARGLIERTALPGDRHVYYRLADDPYGGLISTIIRRKRRQNRFTEDALAELPESADGARRRLERMLRFHRLVIHNLETIVEEWKAERDAERQEEDGTKPSRREIA